MEYLIGFLAFVSVCLILLSTAFFLLILKFFEENVNMTRFVLDEKETGLQNRIIIKIQEKKIEELSKSQLWK